MEISMAKRPLWYLMLGTVMLGLAVSPAFADDDDSSGGGNSQDSSDGAAATNDGNDGGTSAGEASTGGAATGSDLSAGEASTNQGGQSAGDTQEHNCQGGQRWNPQSAACTEEGGPATGGQGGARGAGRAPAPPGFQPTAP
jgi:hypothetical protein